MTDTDITPELQAAVEHVVRGELGRFGVGEIEVIDAEDHEGEPAILVLIHYDSPDAEPDPKVMAGTVSKLNDRLYAMKDRRFGYISHRVPERERRARAR